MRQREKVVTLYVSTPGTFSHAPHLGECHFRPETLATFKAMSDISLVYNEDKLLERIDFPFKHYQEVLRAVSKFQPDLKLAPIPPATLAAMQHALGVKLPPRDQLLRHCPASILDGL